MSAAHISRRDYSLSRLAMGLPADRAGITQALIGFGDIYHQAPSNAQTAPRRKRFLGRALTYFDNLLEVRRL